MSKGFDCEFCNYTCNRKYNLKKHIDARHKETLPKHMITCSFCNIQCLPDHLRTCWRRMAKTCRHCDKEFKHAPSKIRHEKKCSKNQVPDGSSRTDTIVVNEFGSERLDYLEPAFIVSCIKHLNSRGDGVAMMVEKMYLNKEVPENHNVLVDSLRRDQLKLYEDGRWNIYSKASIFDRMIDNVRNIMHRFYNSPEGEELKSKDETDEYNRFYIQCLIGLINIITEKKYYLYRSLYAKFVNFHKLLLEDKAKLTH